jgi:hypothetical protein
MTAQETAQLELPVKTVSAGRITSTRSAAKAYDRRVRRQEQVRGSRLTRTGSPVTAALTRVPFVALVLLLLAGGVVGVLYLNTVSDAAGLRASQSRLAQMDLNTRIEAANMTIAAMKDPARLAAEAKALGLVLPADAAMIQIGPDGKVTVIGKPTVVPSPTPAPAPTAPPVTAVATVVVVAPTAPTPPKVAAPKVVAPTATAATVVAPKVIAPKATAPKTTAPKVVPPKAPAARTTPATTTTGAHR